MLTYKGHSERVAFTVACIRKEDMILRLPWLRQHNLEVDWTTGKIKMMRYPTHCNIYQAELQAEQWVRQAEAQLKDRCRAGPFPLVEEDSELDDEDIDQYEDGNRIFATVIQATGNFLQ